MMAKTQTLANQRVKRTKSLKVVACCAMKKSKKFVKSTPWRETRFTRSGPSLRQCARCRTSIWHRLRKRKKWKGCRINTKRNRWRHHALITSRKQRRSKAPTLVNPKRKALALNISSSSAPSSPAVCHTSTSEFLLPKVSSSAINQSIYHLLIWICLKIGIDVQNQNC